ncbi:MAG: alpha/beta fold hydrolase [Acidobacteriota bacterium]
MSAERFPVPGYAAGTLPAALYPADPARDLRRLLLLAHGAGAGHASPWMVEMATGLAARGLTVVTFNFPYMEGRRRVPDRPPVLEDAFARAIDAARARPDVPPGAPAIGGKSMGGRIATYVATARADLAGVVAFGYPLRPPGARAGARPPDRASHLARLQAPLLVVQGTRDAFGGPADIAAAAPAGTPLTIVEVEGGDHSLKVPARAPRPQAEVNQAVWEAVAAFLSRASAGAPPPRRGAAPGD